MLNAQRQAEEYARALPAGHGWPPFILVCDVGHCIEVYADFTGQGKNYAQFPDRQGFRIYLEDLRDAGDARAAARDLDRAARARPGAGIGEGDARDRRAAGRRCRKALEKQRLCRRGRGACS